MPSLVFLQEVRICCEEGKEWFCLSDVCKALEINNPRDVKKRLQQRGVVTIDTPTYNQHGTMVMQPMTYIDEPNLYRCIFQRETCTFLHLLTFFASSHQFYCGFFGHIDKKLYLCNLKHDLTNEFSIYG